MCLVSSETQVPSGPALSSSSQQIHAAVEQKLQCGVGHLTQHASQVTMGGQAMVDVPFAGRPMGGRHRKAQDPRQGGIVQQELAQVGHVR